jgi:phosphopantothenate synthetase
MTDQQREAIKRLLAKQADFHTAHPDAARAFLLSTGIYTADGKLAPAYDGDEPLPETKR